MALKSDDLVDLHFVPGPTGRVAYYPARAQGRGYWVDTPATEQALRKATRQTYQPIPFTPLIALAAVLAPRLGASPYAALAFVALPFLIHFIWWRAQIARLTRPLEKAPSLVPPPARLQSLAASRSYPWTIAITGLMLIFALYATKGAIEPQQATATGIGGAAFLWFLTGWAATLLVAKLRMTLQGVTPTAAQRAYAANHRAALVAILLLFALSVFAAFVAALTQERLTDGGAIAQAAPRCVHEATKPATREEPGSSLDADCLAKALRDATTAKRQDP